MFGWTELLIVFGIVVLLFGASKLPKVARSLGESINEFKDGLNEDTLEDSPESLDEPDDVEDEEQ
jgi:sec-independent protein translocase protein TatA